MPDTITEARLSRTIGQLNDVHLTLGRLMISQKIAGEGELETAAALQTLTSSVLELAHIVRTIAQRNPNA